MSGSARAWRRRGSGLFPRKLGLDGIAAAAPALESGMVAFTVILPSYNHAAYVETAVRSVLDQDFGDLELIAIDDASRDESPRILQELAGSDPRLRVRLHSENLGIAKTLNEGLALASGEHLTFLMSDDVWLQGKLTGFRTWHRRFPGHVLWSDGELIDERGTYQRVRAHDVTRVAGRSLDGDVFRPL